MTKIAIILTQGFADWEYALIAGIGGPFYGLDIRFFAPEVGEVRSQGGLTAVVSHHVEEIPNWSPKAIIVVGGMIWASEDAPDISRLLKKQYMSGAVVAGICGGTLALARAGLLNKIVHTSNEADFLIQNVQDYSGSEYYRQSVAAISDNRVITAPGSAPSTFTAAIFEAVGIEQNIIKQFKKMVSAEHF